MIGILTKESLAFKNYNLENTNRFPNEFKGHIRYSETLGLINIYIEALDMKGSFDADGIIISKFPTELTSLIKSKTIIYDGNVTTPEGKSLEVFLEIYPNGDMKVYTSIGNVKIYRINFDAMFSVDRLA